MRGPEPQDLERGRRARRARRRQQHQALHLNLPYRSYLGFTAITAKAEAGIRPTFGSVTRRLGDRTGHQRQLPDGHRVSPRRLVAENLTQRLLASSRLRRPRRPVRAPSGWVAASRMKAIRFSLVSGWDRTADLAYRRTTTGPAWSFGRNVAPRPTRARRGSSALAPRWCKRKHIEPTRNA